MRVNVSVIISSLTVTGLIAGIFKKNSPQNYVFYILELILVSIFVILYRDIDVFSVIPGIMLREGFFLSFISLAQANILLTVIMISANVLWILPEKQRFRR